METAMDWQNRTLAPVYPIVYMDAVHFKVRQEHKIVNIELTLWKALIDN